MENFETLNSGINQTVETNAVDKIEKAITDMNTEIPEVKSDGGK